MRHAGRHERYAERHVEGSEYGHVS
jgi:hypothetical protein